ncbi:hypothetical protein ASC64_18965 [Nocardioides sp. Root122]|uniref:glycosyltransferase family 2 protein n=1 Tax=Nocardioides TaxID=1839 RepID=UPI00070321DC|nr:MULTISPECIES: galactosyltransferase-related protein [Nocardioides]KQV73518.1 hypothetical protein ASC64_18965 [Nocardioides sp. Root122]MCK9825219.1 galactosyltransferase-related protein [Nocardioides cavernae]
MTGSATAVVTVVHGRHEHLARQRASLAASTTTAYEHVVVAVDDPSVSGSSVSVPAHPLGLTIAAARNRGADHALSLGATTLVFLDVDCLAGPGLLAAYADVVAEEPTTIWSGPVTYLDPPPPEGYDLSSLGALDAPHPARPDLAPGERAAGADPDLFWSLSFACSAEAWVTTGGFCEDYVGYGGEDTDFARVALRAGVELGWVGAARAYHQWHPVSRPPVEHVVDIVRNAEIYRQRWGVVPMRGWLESFAERGLVRRDDDGRWLLTA